MFRLMVFILLMSTLAQSILLVCMFVLVLDFYWETKLPLKNI